MNLSWLRPGFQAQYSHAVRQTLQQDMFSRYRYPNLRQIVRLIGSLAKSAIIRPRTAGHVLMLHTGRSGSTLLANMLDRHPEIFCDGETLERPFHQLAHAKGTSIADQFGAIGLEDAMDRLATRKKRLSAGRIYCAELQLYQLEMLQTTLPDFLAAIETIGFDRFILLNRRNHLRKIVSHMIATTYDRHHVKRASVKSAPVTRVNPQRCFVGHQMHPLVKRIDDYEGFFEEATRLLQDRTVLHLDYDADISDDPMTAYRRTCDFLNVAHHPTTIGLKKTANFPLFELIENYDDVVGALEDTPHAWMAPPALSQ